MYAAYLLCLHVDLGYPPLMPFFLNDNFPIFIVNIQYSNNHINMRILICFHNFITSLFECLRTFLLTYKMTYISCNIFILLSYNKLCIIYASKYCVPTTLSHLADWCTEKQKHSLIVVFNGEIKNQILLACMPVAPYQPTVV